MNDEEEPGQPAVAELEEMSTEDGPPEEVETRLKFGRLRLHAGGLRRRREPAQFGHGKRRFNFDFRISLLPDTARLGEAQAKRVVMLGEQVKCLFKYFRGKRGRHFKRDGLVVVLAALERLSEEPALDGGERGRAGKFALLGRQSLGGE